MDRLDTMKVFVAVAEAQGFAAAARQLRLSPPAVTRAVVALEQRIGARLLHRTTRTVRLTEAGERAKDALRPLDVARVEAMLEALWPEDRRRAVDGLLALADAADAIAATNRSRLSSI